MDGSSILREAARSYGEKPVLDRNPGPVSLSMVESR